MNFVEFEATARRVFASIPPEYREGVDGLEVERTTVTHPSLPEVYTLGECVTEQYPTEFGGAGDVRSTVVLYFGSFLATARGDDEYDWEGEIFETITHEVRHHLESLAAEDALEELDYAEDQNFARREGEPFDPFFYRMGNRLESGAWEVDGDVFVEVRISPRERSAGVVEIRWKDAPIRVPVVEPTGPVSFVPLDSTTPSERELFAVLVHAGGPIDWLRELFRSLKGL